MDKKKRHTHEKKKDLEAAQLQTDQQTFDKRIFHCEEDAKEALDKWKPGRPKNGAILEEIVTFHIQLTVTFDEQVYEETCRRASRFVLVATVPPEYREKTINAEEILRLYKGQIQVEMNFSFLKDSYFVDEIYLMKPTCLEVLGYIFLLALLFLQSIPMPYSSAYDEEQHLNWRGKTQADPSNRTSNFPTLYFTYKSLFLRFLMAQNKGNLANHSPTNNKKCLLI